MSESPFDKKATQSDADRADESIQQAAAFDIPDLHDLPEPFEAAPVRLPPAETPQTIVPSPVAPSTENPRNDQVELLPEYRGTSPIAKQPESTDGPAAPLPDVPGSAAKEEPIDAIVVLPSVPPAAPPAQPQDEYELPPRPAVPPPPPVEPAPAAPVIDVSYSDTKQTERQPILSGKMPPGRALGFWSTCGIVFAGLIVAIAFTHIPISAYFTANHTSIFDDQFKANNSGYLFAWTNIAIVVPWAMFVSVFAIGRGSLRNPRKAEITKGSMLGYLGFKRVPFLRFLFWGIILPGALITLLYFLGRDTGSEVSSEEFATGILANQASLPFVVFVLLVIAPIFEEIIFRGFMFRGIEKSPLGPVGAILVTSFVFTIVHQQYAGTALIGLFVLSLLLGLTRARTGSIIPAITMHFIFNAGAVAAYFLYQ